MPPGGAGVRGGIPFEDCDGMAMAVQDTGEGEAGGSAPDHGDTMRHADTLYSADTTHRKRTV